ncbi:hypothetical protein KY362_03470, partial [Candidatus Woesearchaeota archaeon]|nr:hypothetical protein [Candidatus Woesearchaeota archaeon]
MYKRKTHRKAQMTIFFIIGLLILAVFAMLWYLNARVAETQLTGPTEKIITDLLKTGAVPYYVGVCLEEQAKDGLTFVGETGGDIFTIDGGPAPWPTKVYNVTNRETFGISRPKLENDTIYPEPPGYPGGVGAVQQVPELRFGEPGRFGEVTLRRLCDVNGANSPHLFPPPNFISNVFCFQGMYSADYSTQWQLETYLEMNILNCTNWTAIRRETGYNVTATGEPNVTFRLGLTDVWADAYIPIRIEVGGQEPIFTVADFHQRFPVRLKRIVEFAATIANYDSFYLDWNMSRDYMIPGIYDTDMEFGVFTDYSSEGVWDDLVVIRDSASVIDGKNYIYKFARENRHPALDYIGVHTNWTMFDIVVMEGQEITINPNPPVTYTPTGEEQQRIYDPDEDHLTYYYTGWMETCNESFNFDAGMQNKFELALCSWQEPSHPSLYFLFPYEVGDMLNMSGEGWVTGRDWTVPEEVPRQWTQSEAYQETHRNATYTPTHDDIGPHNVTVWVCDEAGLCDYQIIRIMVFDYPELYLNGSNHYHDIPDDRASVEDVYELSADGTRKPYFGSFLAYAFADQDEPFQYVTLEENPVINLPRPMPLHSTNIQYIWNYTFNRSYHCNTNDLYETDTRDPVTCLEAYEIHRINLTIPELSVPPKRLDVSVYQCLPHRSDDDPWPYNKTGDAYDADHRCCSLGYQFNTSVGVHMGLSFAGPPDDPTEKKTVLENHFKDDFGQVVLHGPEGEVCRKNSMFTVSPLNPMHDALRMVASLCTGDGVRMIVTPQSIELMFMPDRVPLLDEVKYTVEQTAATPADYRPWGSWLGQTATCYEEPPSIGIYYHMKTHEEAVEPPAVGDTNMLVAMTRSDDSLYNDPIASSFKRKCSSNRGNVCDGEAELFLEPVQNCQDINRDLGEQEACNGPAIYWPHTQVLAEEGLDPATGLCTFDIGGECYHADVACTSSGYSGTITQRGSFELRQNLKRYPTGIDADGICNPNPTCGNNKNAYDVTNDGPAQYILKGATCEAGAIGTCSWTLPGAQYKVDCHEFTGRAESGEEFLDGEPDDYDWYCRYNGEIMQTYNYECEYKEGAAYDQSRQVGCKEQPSMVEPDFDRNACAACMDPALHPYGAPNAKIRTVRTGGEYFSSNCCGDDPDEGGYPFGEYMNGFRFRTLPSGSPSTFGNYQSDETICNDYFGSAGDADNPTHWIDNDCKDGANCEDWKCGGRMGPTGRACCSIDSQCRRISSLNNDAHAECRDDMCHCAPARSALRWDDWAGTYTSPYMTTGPFSMISLCVASRDAVFAATGYDQDRHIVISPVDPREYTFTIDAVNVDGGLDCR